MYSLWTGERRIFRPANGLLRVRRTEDLFSFALCVAVLCAGIMLLGQALDQYNRAKTMAAWPTVIGRITQVGIEPAAANGELRWRPMVRYMYDVNGQTIMNNTLSQQSSRDSYSEEEAKRLVATFPPNTAVVVFYNPEHPTEAVLDHSLPNFAWFCLFAGMALASAGGARLLVAYRVFWR